MQLKLCIAAGLPTPWKQGETFEALQAGAFASLGLANGEVVVTYEDNRLQYKSVWRGEDGHLEGCGSGCTCGHHLSDLLGHTHAGPSRSDN